MLKVVRWPSTYLYEGLRLFCGDRAMLGGWGPLSSNQHLLARMVISGSIVSLTSASDGFGASIPGAVSLKKD